MADDPKVDNTKNPTASRAGTDINKNAVKVEKLDDTKQDEQSDEDKANAEAAKAHEDRMGIASKLYDDPEHDVDTLAGNDLVAYGLATVCAEQKGTEVRNYFELTDEGRRAVQAHNSQTD